MRVASWLIALGPYSLTADAWTEAVGKCRSMSRSRCLRNHTPCATHSPQVLPRVKPWLTLVAKDSKCTVIFAAREGFSRHRRMAAL